MWDEHPFDSRTSLGSIFFWGEHLLGWSTSLDCATFWMNILHERAPAGCAPNSKLGVCRQVGRSTFQDSTHTATHFNVTHCNTTPSVWCSAKGCARLRVKGVGVKCAPVVKVRWVCGCCETEKSLLDKGGFCIPIDSEPHQLGVWRVWLLSNHDYSTAQGVS